MHFGHCTKFLNLNRSLNEKQESIGRVKNASHTKNYAIYPSDRFLLFLVPISGLSLEKYEEKRKGKETGKGETKTILLPIPDYPFDTVEDKRSWRATSHCLSADFTPMPKRKKS